MDGLTSNHFSWAGLDLSGKPVIYRQSVAYKRCLEEQEGRHFLLGPNGRWPVSEIVVYIYGGLEKRTQSICVDKHD